MISIVIPSVNEKYLQRTIDDIRKNAKGEIEIIVAFDGVEGSCENARIIKSDKVGLRGVLNRGFSEAKGDYFIKVDEHCKFDEGFDVKLLSSIEDNWIVVPKRYTLDVEKWEIIDGPIEYERLVIDRTEKIGGVGWRQRAEKRKDIPIDETMVFQGSFWMMPRKHFEWLGGLQEEGYGPFAQEAIELALKTWLGGGKVMVNKTTWYAHKHRKFGRYAYPCGKLVDEGNRYSKDFWINNKWDRRVHDLDWLMKRFGL